MARISTYVIDGTIVDDDKVIGSDANNDMVTKNYKVGDLVAYFAVAIGDYLVPYTNATGDVDLGPYSLFATNLSISGTFTAGGTEGLTGQVLMSQGSGNPAVWGYNIGSQDLEDVLNNGNTGSRNILLGSFGSSIKLDVESNILTSTGIQLYDVASTNTSYWVTNEIGLQDGSQTFIQLIDRTIYSNGTNSITVLASNYQNQTFIYPNYGGAFVMSVNGTFADMSGNINITPGSGGLGSVTQVNTSAPLTGGPITTTGTIGITQSSSSTDGYLSNTDWNAFDAKQDAITLTTTGTSGPATFAGNILNIPQYSGGSGSTPTLQQVLTAGRTELNSTSNFILTLNEPITVDETKVFHAEYDAKPYIKSEIFLSNFGSEPYFNFGIQEKLSGSGDDWVELRPSGAEFYRSGSTYSSKIAIPVNNTVNYTNTLPKADGVFALTVNGQSADSVGAITIPVGASVGFEMNFLLMGA